MPSVKYSDLESALQFVSSGAMVDAYAYLNRETGATYWVSDDSGFEEEIPDDVDDSNLYAVVPGQRDLDLGKSLVMDFTSQVLPERHEEVDSIFRRKGAYSRYKELLLESNLLDAWHEFEKSAVKKALIEWAESEGFSVEE